LESVEEHKEVKGETKERERESRKQMQRWRFYNAKIRELKRGKHLKGIRIIHTPFLSSLCIGLPTPPLRNLGKTHLGLNTKPNIPEKLQEKKKGLKNSLKP